MKKIKINFEDHSITCSCGYRELMQDASLPYCPNCKAYHFGCGNCGLVHTMTLPNQIKILTYVNDVTARYLEETEG